jgi:hypothetical protein
MPFSIGVDRELPSAGKREHRGGDSNERASIGLKRGGRWGVVQGPVTASQVADQNGSEEESNQQNAWPRRVHSDSLMRLGEYRRVEHQWESWCWRGLPYEPSGVRFAESSVGPSSEEIPLSFGV